jgi:hypothetical protein
VHEDRQFSHFSARIASVNILAMHTESSTGFAGTRQDRRSGGGLKMKFYDGREIHRLAVLGGAYGNVPAVTACLEHARGLDCDGFAFIGDATGCCGHSDEIVQLVRDHFPILVAGNLEQKAVAGSMECGCNYASAEDEYYGGLAHQYAMKSLSEANRAWLGTWPDLGRLETTIGTILLCHGSPAQTNEFLFESELDMTRLVRWLDEFEAIGFVCTHSGFPWIRLLPAGRFALNCGVAGKPDHDHDAAVHYATIDLRDLRLEIERVEYDHLAWADQLDVEGVDDLFTIPIRNGVWTCGILSMPPAERVLRPRPLDWLNADG